MKKTLRCFFIKSFKRIALFLFKYTIFRCYVAGETEAEALEMARRLHSCGFGVISDILGEAVTSDESALRYALRYVSHMNHVSEILRENPDTRFDVSAKLSSFGIRFNPKLAFLLSGRILNEASRRGIELQIDMEGPELMSQTIAIVYDLIRDFRLRNPGKSVPLRLALPANQLQSHAVFSQIARTGVRIRVVKGAYAGDIPDKSINDYFLNLLHRAVAHGADTAMGTHDKENIIEKAWNNHPELKLQGLFGVRMFYQEKLARSGRGNYIYMPWGSVDDAFLYLSRRIKEGIRPKVLALFLMNVIESIVWRAHASRKINF